MKPSPGGFTLHGVELNQNSYRYDAKRPFDLGIKARTANAELPRISVDSLQAIGGGGGSSNDYPRRQVALTEIAVRHLNELVKLARERSGGIE